MDKLERIKQLIKDLNNASYAYYSQVPIMPDYEWDKMYDELINLEEETGIVLANSPTHNVGYSVSDELKEVEHNHPMLSLDKTKSIDELRGLGLRHITGALKGKDSINNGIQFIQDFEIIIHPRCVNFITEISNYTWDEDKFGNKINRPIDDCNHLMDAMRYAVEKYINQKKLQFGYIKPI